MSKHYRGDFSLAYNCVKCGERKPPQAYTQGNKGVCNVCVRRRSKTNQDFNDKKNKIIFDKEIRKANSDYDWPSERELNKKMLDERV